MGSERWQTEGVREDGTLDGGYQMIETHVLPPEGCYVAPGPDGYLRIIGSFMDVMVEMRVPLTLCREAGELVDASPEPSDDGGAS